MSRSDSALPDPSVQALVDDLSRLSAPDGALLLDGVPAARIPELLRLTHTGWLAEEEFRREVTALAEIVRGRGGRVEML